MSDTKTILIVDDSESDRLLFRRYLQRYKGNSYQVIEAETIQQGLKLWRSHQPDVVLVDFHLTDGNGLEFLEAIQTNSKNVSSDRKLPVIMLTGHEDTRTAVNAMKLGASDYLVKNDITEFSLNQAIKSLLDRIELNQQLERSQQRERLVSQISLNISQFLNLEQICQTITQEICECLQVDRTLIYKFEQDMQRRIIAESLIPPWSSCLNFMTEDGCFNLTETQIKKYQEGQILIANDVRLTNNLSECHIQMLESFQIRANVVVPIVISAPLSDALNPHEYQPLWGLLIVHQCSVPRHWQEHEILLLQQLSVQVAIAIQQAEIHQNLQILNASLERQVQERTAELRTSEEKTRTILNSLPDIINLFSKDGDYIESVANNLAYDLVPPDIDRQGKNITELLPESVAVKQLEAIRQASLTGEVQTFEQTFAIENKVYYEEVRVVPLSEDSAIILVRDVSDRKYAAIELQHQYQRAQILTEVTLKIRQSLNIEEILQTTTTEVKKILEVDRILILKLDDDGSADIVGEAVSKNLYSFPEKHIDKPIFHDDYIEQYRLGNLIKIDNIDTDQNITEAHADFLRQLHVKAHITMPILQSHDVWGLIVVDQCDRPRQWTDFEIELMQQLANQVAIAITQSQLVASLQKSEQQRRLAVDLSYIGCWDFDVTTGKSEWNENHFRLIGLEPNQQESNYSTWVSRLHPEDVDFVEEAVAQSLENNYELNVEYRVVYPSGEVHWVLSKGRGLYDQAGRATRMLGVMIDISDRKYMELALKKELTRNKTLLNNSFDGIVILDGEGHIVEANPSFAMMLGYTLEEIHQLSIYDIDIRWTTEELQKGVQEFQLGKRVKFETQYLKKERSVCYVEVSASSIEWDGTIYQFCICRDITQRKIDEVFLQQSIQRERMLNQFIQTIRSSLNLEVVFKSANNAIASLLNLDQAGVVQYLPERKVWKYIAVFRDNSDLLAHVGLEIPDEDNPIAVRLKQLKVVEVNDASKMEDEMNHELAKRKTGACLLVPIIVNDQIWGSFSLRIAHKITRWEEHEIELAKTIASQLAIAIRQVNLYQQLELELAERKQTERELAKAKELAEAANKAKSDFLANMSHEIRTPMNGVLGMAQLLTNTPLNEEQQDFVKTILDSGDLLLTVINDILDFSKIESGKLQLETKEFNFTEAINSVCNLLSKQAFDKNINLQCYINYNVPTTFIGDSLRLRQILVNLVGNAIKFTDKGKVSIRVDGQFITSTLYEFRFAIIDTGLGIDGDRIDKLFQPFTQADASINRQFGGTGLGLAICKRLVEMMGGTIWVESRGFVGGNPPTDWRVKHSTKNTQGSTFHFAITLPVASSTQLGIKPPNNFSLSELKNELQKFPLKILVVEDNILNQKIALLMLQRLGYEADIANNGRESAEILLNQESSEAYDIVFMDVQMPVMDGLTATRRIRENSLSKTKPWIVALTADALPEDCQACLDAGMNDYISKPVSLKALGRSLSAYLETRNSLP